MDGCEKENTLEPFFSMYFSVNKIFLAHCANRGPVLRFYWARLDFPIWQCMVIFLSARCWTIGGSIEVVHSYTEIILVVQFKFTVQLWCKTLATAQYAVGRSANCELMLDSPGHMHGTVNC